MMHLYKPPPPYPYSKAGSNSSPDLAVVQSGAAFSINTGSVGHLPTPHSAIGMENESSLVFPTGDSGLHSEQHLQVKNGEPIYQNVPMRQLGSNPSLSSTTVNRSQASLQHLQQLQQHGLPKRKWAIPGLSSQRGRNAPRTAVINPNPSSSVQPQNTQANVKDHLVNFMSYSHFMFYLNNLHLASGSRIKVGRRSAFIRIRVDSAKKSRRRFRHCCSFG